MDHLDVTVETIMPDRIILTDPLPLMIRDTSATEPLLDPAAVAAALGAEPTGVRIPSGGSPMGRFAARMVAYRTFQPGDPATAAADYASFAFDAAEWAEFQRLVTTVAGVGGTATSARVAHNLFMRSLRSALAELDAAPDPAAAPLARELAASS